MGPAVGSQNLFVLFMRAELKCSVRDNSDHGGRVTPPEAEEAFILIGLVNQLHNFLWQTAKRTITLWCERKMELASL